MPRKSKLPSETLADRVRRLERLQEAGWTPVTWSVEAQEMAPGPLENCYRVRCPHCPNVYHHGSGTARYKHLQAKHGYEFSPAWDKAHGLEPYEVFKAKLAERMAALDAELGL